MSRCRLSVIGSYRSVAVILAVLLPASPLFAKPDPRVTANAEILEGVWEGPGAGVAAFKGVPFAAPPVNQRRWRAPQPHQPRAGLQGAVAFAPACMQTDYLVQWYAGVAQRMGHPVEVVGRPVGVSEDCLYLNIWTPQVSDEAPLPVMLWVHGGSNKSGWSYEPNYVGAQLAGKGVVVVSIAYRLGSFGYFSHPALDNGAGEPVANFAILDMAFAFSWVKKHIRAFGGDPDNITAFGESSGAGNIRDYLLAGNLDTGLFEKSVAQSPAGALNGRRTLADEQKAGEQLLAYLGYDNATLTMEQMRAVPAEEILRASVEGLPGHYYDMVLDGLNMVEMPTESLSREQLSSIRFLVGSNRDEWYMYIDEDAGWADVDRWLQEQAPEVAALLRNKVATEQDPRRALDRLMTAKDLRCPLNHMAATVNAAGGSAWVYYFSRQRPGDAMNNLGAYHGTEIGYVFDAHESWQPVDSVDRQLTAAVMDYWVQFARNGDPNLEGRPAWPRYTVAAPTVMELGDQVRVIPSPDADLCLWLGPGK